MFYGGACQTQSRQVSKDCVNSKQLFSRGSKGLRSGLSGSVLSQQSRTSTVFAVGRRSIDWKVCSKGRSKERSTQFVSRFMDRYLGSQNEAAVNAYCKIAKEAGISPAELALSWCYHNEHVTSTIIGATTIPQLKEDVKAYDIRLDEETMEKISRVNKQYTDPTKAS